MRLFQTSIFDPATIALYLHVGFALSWAAIAFTQVRNTPYVVYASMLFPSMALATPFLYLGWLDAPIAVFVNCAGLFFLYSLFITRGRQESQEFPFAKFETALGVLGLIISVMGVLAFFGATPGSFLAEYEDNMIIGYFESLLLMTLAFLFMRNSRRNAALELDRFMVASVFYSTAGGILGFIAVMLSQ